MLELNRYDRLDPLDRPYTEDERREMDALTARQDELAEQYDALSEDDENAYEEGERIEAELNAVTAAIQALETRTQAWDAQQMAEAGAFVILDPQGNLTIERGLVRRGSEVGDGAGAATIGQPFFSQPRSAWQPGHPIIFHPTTRRTPRLGDFLR